MLSGIAALEWCVTASGMLVLVRIKTVVFDVCGFILLIFMGIFSLA